ncbi:MAG: restriction endonuclease subunit S [Prevotella sp.]|nr:restriction endonuclease subunit S [Prevotellaceae bacterium]MDY5843261.1 restriction endonuclease subunit S [Prevotella sp.]
MFGNPLSDVQKYGLKKLGECCELNPRRPRLGLEDSDLVSFVPMPSVSENGHLVDVADEEYGKVKKGFTYFENNDVLFAKITPCMENGKGAIAQDLTNGIGMGSTEFHVLRPLDDVSNAYWLLALTRMPIFRERASKNMSGTGGQKRVGTTFLENFLVGLPPISEQQTFEAIAEQADKSKFVGFKSQFIEMFGKSKTNRKISDVAIVVSGKSIPKNLEDIEGDFAYIKVADFNLPVNNKNIVASSRYVTQDNARTSKCIPIGSTIFAKNGAAAMSNKKRITKVECCIDMNTMAVIPNQSIIPEFLYSVFESVDLSAFARQGAVPSMSPHSVKNMELYLPDIEEQQMFVSIAEQADKSKLI